jgi:hypothetical protein
MVLRLSDRYTLAERRIHLQSQVQEESVGLDSYTAMIRGFLWISECYDLRGGVERFPCSLHVDQMTRTWVTYTENLPGFREEESLNSLVGYCTRFQSQRAFAQLASELEEHDEPLFCRQCRVPREIRMGGGSSWGPPPRVPGVWSSGSADSNGADGNDDPPAFAIQLPTDDDAPRYHVDSHGVRWELCEARILHSHSEQREEPSWGENPGSVLGGWRYRSRS